MSTFPVLKTGAVAQYPASRTVEHATRVLTFLDGSEQRFRLTSGAARSWVIRLAVLDETEMSAIEEFLVSRQGRLGSFAFTDPWDGTVYPDCSLESDVNPLTFADVLRGRATLTVRENRS
jgi:hypothetical protein